MGPRKSEKTRLLILVTAVLAVHLWLLGASPQRLPTLSTRPVALQASTVVPAVQTRSLPPDSEPKPAAAPTPAAAAVAVQPPAKTPGRKPAPAAVVQTEEMGSKTAVSAVSTPSIATNSVAKKPESAVHVPDTRSLHYEVSGQARGFPYRARADLLWRHDGPNYSARLEIIAILIGSRVQTSEGQVTPEGLAPQRFSDKLRREVAAHFERDKGKVTFSVNTPDVPLEPGAQDRLSVLLQLSSLLAGDPGRYPEGSVVAMQTVGPRDADVWHFVVGAEEHLSLPGGEHIARKLSREPKREFDLQVDVWLAPDMAYLPVQVKMTQSTGDFVMLQLKSIDMP